MKFFTTQSRQPTNYITNYLKKKLKMNKYFKVFRNSKKKDEILKFNIEYMCDNEKVFL